MTEKKKLRPKEITIPNYSVFGLQQVFLDIMAVEMDEGTAYHPTISFWLDDGREHEDKVVTIALDNFVSDEDNVEEMIRDVATYLGNIFNDICETVTVYDIAGEAEDEYNLNEMFDDGRTIN